MTRGVFLHTEDRVVVLACHFVRHFLLSFFISILVWHVVFQLVIVSVKLVVFVFLPLHLSTYLPEHSQKPHAHSLEKMCHMSGSHQFLRWRQTPLQNTMRKPWRKHYFFGASTAYPF